MVNATFTERQNLLLSMLREQGRTTGDALAASLNVSKRTIYRDLETIARAGIAVRTEGGPGGGIWIDDEETTIPLAVQNVPADSIEAALAASENTASDFDAPFVEEPASEFVTDAAETTETETATVTFAENVAENIAESPQTASATPTRAESPASTAWFDALTPRWQEAPTTTEIESLDVESGEVRLEHASVPLSAVPVSETSIAPAATTAPAAPATPIATAPLSGSPAAAPADLASAVRERILLDTSGFWQEEMPSQVVVDLLQEAIFSNRVMRIQYAPGGTGDPLATLGATVRVVEPYGLVAKGGVWYLVARQGNQFVADRLSRIQSAEQLSGRFERIPVFDLARWWSESGDQYVSRAERYRFTALVRRNRVEFLRMYVGGQLQVDPVDSQWTRVRLEVDSPAAAVMTVLGLGQDAVVIEPDDLPLLVRRAAAGRPLNDSGGLVQPVAQVHAPAPRPTYALG